MIYLLSHTGIDSLEGVIHLPVICIRYLKPDIGFSNYDAILFTSKNGVLAIQKDQESWRKLPCYAIGESTALVLEKMGANIAYVSSKKSGDLFAGEIMSGLKGKHVLYPRAKKIVSSLPELLREEGVTLDEKIVYETVCNEETLPRPEPGSILLFASPSAVVCFLKCYEWDSSYRAAAFGKSTAKAFPETISYSVCQESTLLDAVNNLKATC